MIEIVNEVVEKEPDTGEKYVLVKVTNTGIRMIKSAVNFYQGDNDDPKNKRNQEQLRSEVHEVWKVLNPS